VPVEQLLEPLADAEKHPVGVVGLRVQAVGQSPELRDHVGLLVVHGYPLEDSGPEQRMLRIVRPGPSGSGLRQLLATP